MSLKPGDKVLSSLHRTVKQRRRFLTVENITTTGKIIVVGENNRRLTLWPHQLVEIHA